MKYFVQETCLKTEKVAYLTSANCYGYDLRVSPRKGVNTLFQTKEEAEAVLNEHLAVYPNNNRRETKIRCQGTAREEYVEGMKSRYGNISK
jgi:hypothetical protein